ncbi:MAG: metallophosphoesterase [Dysgonamonadaceae bacterium]|jgi:hypothetical protein|nr:metallophosphoesterase [Dysgonamonadaceae bacterium]
MTSIIIGDVHGSTYWKEIVNEHPDCRYIFLGDYLDPYEAVDDKALLENLQDIIRFKKAHPNEVVLLLGNHDLHYFVEESILCTRFNYALAPDISEIFRTNYRLFQFAYQVDNCLFTHAGVIHSWFIEDFKGDITKNIADQLNNPAPEQIEALFQCGFYRGGKANAVGGIFWADIHELHEPLQGYTQIVGHNRVNDILDCTENSGRIIFCDCLFNKQFLKIEI